MQQSGIGLFRKGLFRNSALTPRWNTCNTFLIKLKSAAYSNFWVTHWEFHRLYFDHIHPSPPPPPRFTTPSFRPPILWPLFSLFLKIHWVQFALPTFSWVSVLHWIHTFKANWPSLSLSLSQHPTVTNSSLARGGRGAHLPVPVVIWSALSKSCACCHNFCEFVCTAALLGLKNALSLWPSTASTSDFLSPLFSHCPLGLWRELWCGRPV